MATTSHMSIMRISNEYTHSCVPTLKVHSAISIPGIPNGNMLKNLNTSLKKNLMIKTSPLEMSTSKRETSNEVNVATTKLHVILEAVLDRIEMHQNIGEQRENWNSLLLNALNMITLTGVAMTGMSEMGGSILPLKVSSTLLFVGATGILLIMNKIQPSQLVEEQRNAVRLLKQLKTRIQTTISLDTPTEKHVEEAMEKVLALDRAYPLTLLGSMLEKFPKKYETAMWWPSKKSLSTQNTNPRTYNNNKDTNGWTKELENDMKNIIGVIKKKDLQDYERLGNNALKLNKTLAKLGPSLMGVATIASALSGHGGPWGGLVAAVAGSMASVVNTMEHGGQVGMVFEMYRNCGGFFTLLEEKVESNLEENDLEKRENGELFEMKMALHLGRSLSELRDFASNSSDEGQFASKLF